MVSPIAKAVSSAGSRVTLWARSMGDRGGAGHRNAGRAGVAQDGRERGAAGERGRHQPGRARRPARLGRLGYRMRSQSGTPSSPAISRSPSVRGASLPSSRPTKITQLRPGCSWCRARACQPERPGGQDLDPSRPEPAAAGAAPPTARRRRFAAWCLAWAATTERSALLSCAAWLGGARPRSSPAPAARRARAEQCQRGEQRRSANPGSRHHVLQAKRLTGCRWRAVRRRSTSAAINRAHQPPPAARL